MVTKHFTDEEIQQLAIGEIKDTGGHLPHCSHCQAMLDEYRMMITAFDEQPVPTLGFDLSSAVMEKLPVPGNTDKAGIDYFPILSCLVLLGLCIFVFRRRISALLPEIDLITMLTIAASLVTILVLFCTDMLSGYRRRMKVLDHF